MKWCVGFFKVNMEPAQLHVFHDDEPVDTRNKYCRVDFTVIK